MVARATGVSGVVGPRVYKVTGVVGEPSDTSAWFPGCRLVHVDRTDSDDRESGCSEFLGCASLGAAHGGRGTIRTVTAYQAGLQIRPSHHRPKCLAHERLMLWTSPYKVGAMDVYNRRLPQLDHDFLRQVEIRANSIMVSTRTTYGSALLIYNVWCDSMLIDDAAHIPTSTTIIISWVSAMTASYATKTISGYVDAIKTWHEIQGVPWRVTEDIVDRTIMGSAAFVPPESNREK
jgi:hypothetical protein